MRLEIKRNWNNKNMICYAINDYLNMINNI